jgi:hypothetical protein
VRWSFAFLVAGWVVLGACAVDPALTAGPAGDAGDEPPPQSFDASFDAQADAPADAVVADATAKDVASKDQSSPQDSSGSDAACTATCPSGTTCQGSTCVVTQGPPCTSAVSATASSGALSGTTCTNTGSSITTTCNSPITGGATFIRFPSSGGPFTGTFKATSGAIQVVVMGSCGGTPTCYSIASGSSANVPIPEGATVAIVSAATCSDYSITYLPS